MLARTARPATCALLAALAGCAEEPSFLLEWRITSDDAVTEHGDAPLLSSVKQCSEVGIEKVRLEARGVDDPMCRADGLCEDPEAEGHVPCDPTSPGACTGQPDHCGETEFGWRCLTPCTINADCSDARFVREYGCYAGAFGAGDSIDGPKLAPGDYQIDLIGLRRNGAQWFCLGEDEGGIATEVGCVRDQSSVTVREGEVPELAFLLRAPIQCDDGVDNDRDGRVDGNDPACTLGEAFESYDAGLTLFQLSVSILGNPVIEPRHVDIDTFELTVDGAAFESLLPSTGSDAVWPWRFRLLDARLDAGPHTIELVAIADGSPITAPQTVDFMVDAEQGAFVIHEFALGSAQFLGPIEDPLAVSWAMGPSIVSPPCGPLLTPIDDMRVRVYQGDSPMALDVDDLRLYPNDLLTNPLVEPGDWLSFACDNGGRLISTMPLTWTETGYSIEIEGRIGGVTCFASELEPLRPGSFSPVSVAALPVLDDQGMPPAGCPQPN